MHGVTADFLADLSVTPCVVRKALMVTVEVDPVRVESRLSAGKIGCPACRGGVLARWGFARARRVFGLAGSVRPRRGRCRSCAVTHVLLPGSLLLRRAYSAAVIMAAVKAKAAGAGYRRIAEALGVPAVTVRGWLRVIEARAVTLWSWFVQIAVFVGVDVSIPKATGSRCGDVLAAIAVATEAITGRFGRASVLGVVTAVAVAVAGSGGRLLAPGWPLAPRGAVSNTN